MLLCNFITLRLDECWHSTYILNHTQECWYYTITYILLTNYIIISIFNIQRCTQIGYARFYVTANKNPQTLTSICREWYCSRSLLSTDLSSSREHIILHASYILNTFGWLSLPHCYFELHLLYKTVKSNFVFNAVRISVVCLLPSYDHLAWPEIIFRWKSTLTSLGKEDCSVQQQFWKESGKYTWS